MTWKDKLAIWIAWHLPRSITMWACVRVATAPGTRDDYPGEQSVIAALKNWDAEV